MPRDSDFDMLVAFCRQFFTQLPSLEKQLSDQVECQKTLRAGHPTHAALFRDIWSSYSQIRLMIGQMIVYLLVTRTPAVEALGLDEEARDKFGDSLDQKMETAIDLYQMGVRYLKKLAHEWANDCNEQFEQCRRLRSECNWSSQEEVDSLLERQLGLLREHRRYIKWADDVIAEFHQASS